MKQSAYIKRYSSWANVPEEIKAKILARPEMTELQRLAQKENFALFILQGMRSNMRNLHELNRLHRDHRLLRANGALMDGIKHAEFIVRLIQGERKAKKKESNHG